MLVVGGSSSHELAKKIAKHRKVPYSSLKVGHFPDGETFVRFMKPVKGKNVVLVQSMVPPNQSIIEILFAAHTAKELGARKVSLVVPYLAYMREDARFHPGECISAGVLAKAIVPPLDFLVTVDPHLHRFHNLHKVYHVHVKRVTANGLIADHIKRHIKNPLVVGPDGESEQWAKQVAEQVGCPVTVMTKTRYSGTKVKVHFKDKVDYEGMHICLVDDIISTGHTLMQNIKHLRKMGVKKITCFGVHGLFVGDAYKELKRLKVDIVTSNTIPHPSNRLDVSGLLAEAIE
ncbi:MAG: ribose-phosphate diphosphokinase [DPANN group archaeon]|nr:ribose-phosphate diphosphokinase [DPANN group archaeon]